MNLSTFSKKSFKRLTSATLIAMMILSSTIFSFPSNLKKNTNKPVNVIVVFKDRIDESAVKSVGGQIRKGFRNFPVASISLPEKALHALKRNPKVKSVESDIKISIASQTVDWGINKIEAPKVWESGYTGKGVKVAIIDTGIAQHPDLLIAGGKSVVAYTSSYSDDHGHGTHVAGIVGALQNTTGIVGVAPDVNLYAIKALDSAGSGYLSDVIAGIDWSISSKMDIINMSLGSTFDSFSLKSAVDKAYQSGILVVAAAGNSGTQEGSEDTVNYPAKYSSAIAVGATDSKDVRATFSSTGKTLEVSAPGHSILSTYPGGRLVRMSGTSMAAPFVAGQLALLKEAYPTLSANELRVKLQESVIDLGAVGVDSWYGYGRITSFGVDSNPPEDPNPPVEEPSEPDPSLTVSTLTTSKATYTAGESVNLYGTVMDERGQPIKNASVKITLTPPRGRTKPVSAVATTNENGQVSFIYKTNSKNTKGIYHATMNSTKDGYISSKSSASFSLR
jgi:minor extracellular protease Epr